MDERMGGSIDPLVGATIAGRYRIVSLIARGGMGKVYRAEQSALGRICALKVVVPGEQAERDPDYFKRFSREASTAAKLRHPNSVTIFDYGKDEEQGVYFIAMEYLDGRTLHQVVHQDGPLPEARANRIAQQICRSLSEAHGHGLVHRDLKPSNVLLLRARGGEEEEEEEQHVKVLDFGLVKDMTSQGDDLTQTGTFMGSPKYTAPEQVMGGEISPRADIYSLGVVMYEMICGKPPFDKKVSTATLMAQVHEAPPPISERNPGAPISPAMEAIVMRCLEKNPDNRFSSMREVLGHLKVAAGEDPLEATRTSRIDLGPMPSRPSLTPLPAATASTPRAAMASTPRVEDSLVPAQPPTFSPVPAPRRRSSSTTYVVAVAAALAGGGVALLVAGRGKQDAAAPTRVESVVVPVAVPAAAAMESNPAAGIRLVRIESNPPGARVSDRGTEVCLATPCRIVLQGEGINAEYRLDLTRGGYRPAVLVVRPSDETASIDLEPVAGDVRVAAAAAPEARATTEPEAPGASTAIAPPQAVEPAAAAAPTPAPAATAEAPPPAQAEQTAAPAAPAAAAATSKVLPFQDGMSRPVPVSPPAPVYTREARAARVQGTVIAKCVITTSGSLTGCRIIKGLPHMNEAVLAALKASRYRPVTFQGRPVAVDYVFSIKIVPP